MLILGVESRREVRGGKGAGAAVEDESRCPGATLGTFGVGGGWHGSWWSVHGHGCGLSYCVMAQEMRPLSWVRHLLDEEVQSI